MASAAGRFQTDCNDHGPRYGHQLESGFLQYQGRDDDPEFGYCQPHRQHHHDPPAGFPGRYRLQNDCRDGNWDCPYPRFSDRDRNWSGPHACFHDHDRPDCRKMERNHFQPRRNIFDAGQFVHSGRLPGLARSVEPFLRHNFPAQAISSSRQSTEEPFYFKSKMCPAQPPACLVDLNSSNCWQTGRYHMGT